LEFQKKQGCGWPKLQRPSQAGWAGAVKPPERSDENSIKIGPLPLTNSLRGVFLSVSSQLPTFTVVSLLSPSCSMISPSRLPPNHYNEALDCLPNHSGLHQLLRRDRRVCPTFPAPKKPQLIPHSVQQRSNSGTCSIGIARIYGDINWDLTVYNCAASERQDFNIIATVKNAVMDKGESITVTSGIPQPIKITNVDNAPPFDYDIQVLQAPLDNPDVGMTKVQLTFEIEEAGLKWTTSDCSAGSVIFSAGWESWSCDYACNYTMTASREL
jgi:hypothetical protein